MKPIQQTCSNRAAHHDSMLKLESQVALKAFSADGDGTKPGSYMPEKHCCTPRSQECLKYMFSFKFVKGGEKRARHDGIC